MGLNVNTTALKDGINSFTPVKMRFFVDTYTDGRIKVMARCCKVCDGDTDYCFAVNHKKAQEVLQHKVLTPPSTRVLPYFDRLQELYEKYTRNEFAISLNEAQFFAKKGRGRACAKYRFIVECLRELFRKCGSENEVYSGQD